LSKDREPLPTGQAPNRAGSGQAGTERLPYVYPVRNNAPLLPLGQAPPRKGSCPRGRPSGPAAAAGLDFRIIPGSTPEGGVYPV